LNLPAAHFVSINHVNVLRMLSFVLRKTNFTYVYKLFPLHKELTLGMSAAQVLPGPSQPMRRLGTHRSTTQGC